MERGNPVWVIPEPMNTSRMPTAPNGTNKFTIASPFLVAVQSKFRRKYYHKIIFAILIVIILILLIAIFVLSFAAHKSNNKCESKECIRAAAGLIQSMDTSVDPCEDFYQFTCGNWAETHPRPDSLTAYDWFSENQAKISRHVRTFLQKNETTSEPRAIHKAKTLYRACVDTDTLDEQGVKPILNYIKELDLPLIPALLNKTLANSAGAYEFDWINSIVKIKKILGMDVMIGFDIFPHPNNRSVNRIAIGTPESGSALPFNDDEPYKWLKKEKRKIIMASMENGEADQNDDDESEEETSPRISAFTTYIRKVSAILMLSVNPEIKIEETLDTLNAASTKIVLITKELYKYSDEAENITKTYDTPYEDILNLNVTELQRQTDELISPKSVPIWEKYLSQLVGGYGFNVSSDEVLTSKGDIYYLQRIAELISDTDLKSIEFFLWWSVVDELAVHTTTNLRRLYADYIHAVIKTEGSTSRSLYCANGISKLMGMAVSYSLANDEFHNNTRPKVVSMLSNIRQAFNNLVQATSWMDDQTKIRTLEKSWSMKSLIGYPEWIVNKTELDEFYGGMEVNVTKHLENMVGVLTWRMKNKLYTLKEENEFSWPISPSQVNAYHTFQANTITVPIAILQYPFYELGLEALNYGAIGAILGHELTHGFDDSGRMFDKSGNMRQWWSNKTIEEYVNRTTCFVKQYAGYYVAEADDYVNGELTLGENIADNGGLREAYYAYKLYSEQNGPEPTLPGLGQFTHEQLLFIAFGNLWCETATPSAMKFSLEDTHSPGQFRLKGVISNSPEFSRTFGCRKGSGMFPTDDRCRLW